MSGFDHFFFVSVPYVVLVVFLVGTIYRYRSNAFTYSSLSAQFLEGRQGFWGTVPFHWGILVVFLGHLFAFAFPETVLTLNSHPARLIIHEGIGFIFGMTLLVGMIVLLVRRLRNARMKVVTSAMDMLVEFLLLAQVVLGLWIAVGYRWGSSWFAADLSPYLWSILKLDPQPEAVYAMPLVIKLHIIGAFSIFLLIAFSRLAHLLVAPFHYLWRPYQVVIWHWDRRRIREASTAWSDRRPANN